MVEAAYIYNGYEHILVVIEQPSEQRRSMIARIMAPKP